MLRRSLPLSRRGGAEMLEKWEKSVARLQAEAERAELQHVALIGDLMQQKENDDMEKSALRQQLAAVREALGAADADAAARLASEHVPHTAPSLSPDSMQSSLSSFAGRLGERAGAAVQAARPRMQQMQSQLQQLNFLPDSVRGEAAPAASQRSSAARDKPPVRAPCRRARAPARLPRAGRQRLKRRHPNARDRSSSPLRPEAGPSRRGRGVAPARSRRRPRRVAAARASSRGWWCRAARRRTARRQRGTARGKSPWCRAPALLPLPLPRSLL